VADPQTDTPPGAGAALDAFLKGGEAPAAPPPGEYAGPLGSALAGMDVFLGRKEWADPAVPADQRAASFVRAHALAGSTYEQVKATAPARLPGVDPAALESPFKLEAAKARAATMEEPVALKGLEMLPGAGAVGGYLLSREYGQAAKRVADGKAADKDYDLVAQYERLQSIRQGEGTEQSVYRGLRHIPAVVGEGLGAGKLARGVGAALGVGAGEGASAAARFGTFAGRQAVTTPLMPALYAEKAAQKNLAEGRPADDWRGFPPALGLAYANNLVLGQMQQQFGAVPGGLAGRAAAKGAVGVGEQAGVDVLAGAVDELLPRAWRTDTRYGTIGDLLRGDTDTAFKHAVVQFITFAAVAAAHDRGPPPPPQEPGLARVPGGDSGLPENRNPTPPPAGEGPAPGGGPVPAGGGPAEPGRPAPPSPVMDSFVAAMNWMKKNGWGDSSRNAAVVKIRETLDAAQKANPYLTRAEAEALFSGDKPSPLKDLGLSLARSGVFPETKPPAAPKPPARTVAAEPLSPEPTAPQSPQDAPGSTRPPGWLEPVSAAEAPPDHAILREAGYSDRQLRTMTPRQIETAMFAKRLFEDRMLARQTTHDSYDTADAAGLRESEQELQRYAASGEYVPPDNPQPYKPVVRATNPAEVRTAAASYLEWGRSEGLSKAEVVQAVQEEIAAGKTLDDHHGVNLQDVLRELSGEAFRGKAAQPPEAPAAAPGGVERRVDAVRRKAVSEMSPDELKRELLASQLVDLPNRRAFDEAAPAKAVAYSDANGLKAINDNFGYAAGDQLLRAKAEALKAAGLDAYHEKGDEFLYRGESEGEIRTKLEAAREILRETHITVRMKDGTERTFKGADFGYGTGHDLATAEARLHEAKEARKAGGGPGRGDLRLFTEAGPRPGGGDLGGTPRGNNGPAQGPEGGQAPAGPAGDRGPPAAEAGRPLIERLRLAQAGKQDVAKTAAPVSHPEPAGPPADPLAAVFDAAGLTPDHLAAVRKMIELRSLRKAADGLGVSHQTVANRIEAAGKALGLEHKGLRAEIDRLADEYKVELAEEGKAVTAADLKGDPDAAARVVDKKTAVRETVQDQIDALASQWLKESERGALTPEREAEFRAKADHLARRLAAAEPGQQGQNQPAQEAPGRPGAGAPAPQAAGRAGVGTAAWREQQRAANAARKQAALDAAAEKEAARQLGVRARAEQQKGGMQAVVRNYGGIAFDDAARGFFESKDEARQYGIPLSVWAKPGTGRSLDQLAQELHIVGHLRDADPQTLVDALAKNEMSRAMDEGRAVAHRAAERDARLQAEEEARLADMTPEERQAELDRREEERVAELERPLDAEFESHLTAGDFDPSKWDDEARRFGGGTGQTRGGALHLPAFKGSNAEAAVRAAHDEWAKLRGEQFPATARVSEPVADRMTAAISAKAYAEAVTEHVLHAVFGDLKPAVWAKFYTAHLEARLAYMRSKGANAISLIGPDSPLKTPAEYHAVLRSPAFNRYLQRWRAVEVPIMDKHFNDATGQPAGSPIHSETQLPDYPINLVRVRQDGSTTSVGSGGRRMTPENVHQRRLGFNRKATGESPHGYETDPRKALLAAHEQGAAAAGRANLDREIVATGQGQWGQPGKPVPKLPDGTPMVPVRDVTPEAGTQVAKPRETTLYVNPAIRDDYHNAIDLGNQFRIPVLTPTLEAATKVAIASTVEAAFHSFNLLQGLSRPYVVRSLAREFLAAVKPLLKGELPHLSGDQLERFAGLAEAGMTKPQGFEAGMLVPKGLAEKYPVLGKLDPTGLASRFLDAVDKLMRLAMDRAFEHMAATGLVPNTKKNKADFLNTLGNYKKQSQAMVVRVLRGTGLGPFATAATNSPVQAIRSLWLSPGVTARSPAAQARLRLHMLLKLAGAVGLAELLNWSIWGRPDGDDDVPFGALKLGGHNGRSYYVDPLRLMGPRRGLHVTGLDALHEGHRLGATPKATFHRAADDVTHSLLHPAVGPGVQFGYTAKTGNSTLGSNLAGKPDDGVPREWENFKAALKNANPTLAALMGADRVKPDEKMPLFPLFGREVPGSPGGLVGQYPEKRPFEAAAGKLLAPYIGSRQQMPVEVQRGLMEKEAAKGRR
jgi:GGDEF domain-containing protein